MGKGSRSTNCPPFNYAREDTRLIQDTESCKTRSGEKSVKFITSLGMSSVFHYGAKNKEEKERDLEGSTDSNVSV